MIRIIVGSLVEIGLEKQTTTLFSEVLKNGNTESLKFTAPAKGLFLEKIVFLVFFDSQLLEKGLKIVSAF